MPGRPRPPLTSRRDDADLATVLHRLVDLLVAGWAPAAHAPAPRPQWVRVRVAAAALDVSPAHLYRLIRRGEGTAFARKLGATIRVNLPALEAWAAERGKPGL